MNRLVRKVAWGGDGRSATVRLELGEGPLAGATVVMNAEGRSLDLLVELPPGVSAAQWEARITQRLLGRGLELMRVEVR
jgi:hypothetical protein